MKRILLILILFISGFAVIAAQRRLFISVPIVRELDNLIAVQADPPEQCDVYTGQCVINGYVYCQDPDAVRYPIQGARVKLDLIGLTDSRFPMFRNTDADGFFNFNENNQEIPEIAGIDVSVVSLPEGSLPTGQLYSNMSGPDKAINGSGDSKYLTFAYSNCSSGQAVCDEMTLTRADEASNKVTINSYILLPQDSQPASLPGIVFHVFKDAVEIATSDAIEVAAEIDPQYGDTRYKASWEYEFPSEGQGVVVYRIKSEIVDTPQVQVAEPQGAGFELRKNISQFINKIQVILQNLPFIGQKQELPEQFQVTPSLKLGTFVPLSIQSECDEILFTVQYET